MTPMQGTLRRENDLGRGGPGFSGSEGVPRESRNEPCGDARKRIPPPRRVPVRRVAAAEGAGFVARRQPVRSMGSWTLPRTAVLAMIARIGAIPSSPFAARSFSVPDPVPADVPDMALTARPWQTGLPPLRGNVVNAGMAAVTTGR